MVRLVLEMILYLTIFEHLSMILAFVTVEWRGNTPTEITRGAIVPWTGR